VLKPAFTDLSAPPIDVFRSVLLKMKMKVVATIDDVKEEEEKKRWYRSCVLAKGLDE
jgi:hypothetical protein